MSDVSEIINLLSEVGLCLFGIAGVLLALFLLRILPRVDRLLTLAEMGAVEQLPLIVRKLLGK